MGLNVDVENVKKFYEGLGKLMRETDYRTFEVAYLIFERLDSVVYSKNDITKEIVDRVNEICNSVDNLLDFWVLEELDDIVEDFGDDETEEDLTDNTYWEDEEE